MTTPSASSTPASVSAARLLTRTEQRLDEVEGQREHDQLGTLVSNVGEGLQVAQLQRTRLLGEGGGSLDERLRRLVLSLGVDDLGAPRAFGLRLLRHRTHHALIEVDVLDLDGRDLDAPGLGALVEDALQVDVELVALRQQIVHLVL